MEITIKNFSAIAEAKVNIGGLTVIAGENDTGKSTVGKLLFSYVKACAGYEGFIEYEHRKDVFNAIELLYFELRRNIDMAEYDDIQQAFLPKHFQSELKTNGAQVIRDRIELIEQMKSQYADIGDYEQIISMISDVETAFNNRIDLRDSLASIYVHFLSNEFGCFASQLFNESIGQIILKDGKTTVFENELDAHENKIRVAEASRLKEVVMVDSGAILNFQQLVDSVYQMNDSFETLKNSEVQYHSLDLVSKLKESEYFVDRDYKSISVQLRNLYNGQLLFDSDREIFVFKRKAKTIKLQNVASGIKVLGITDMLLKGGHFESDKLVILDEPEVNLHPKWQIEYARIICQLVKAGANIVVTTHSPYMFEALSGFSQQKQIGGHFYLAEHGENGAVFSDVSMDTSVVIERLSAPLIKLNEELHGDF